MLMHGASIDATPVELLLPPPAALPVLVPVVGATVFTGICVTGVQDWHEMMVI